ncbi:hypothetical protein ACOMHN_031623 [Nucella lapillus]
MVTVLTRGRVDKKDSSRSRLLRALLLHGRDAHDILSKRGEATNTVNVPVHLECCPTETRSIQPRGGVSREGRLLELYRDQWTVQRLYQTTCHASVVNRPCQLVDPAIKRYSRCVQKYSYAYAFVKDFNVTQHYRLDYVKVRSGCACEVDFSLQETFDYR